MWEMLQIELRSPDTTTNSTLRKPDFAPVPLAYLFQWAQSYSVKSPLQHWNTFKSLDLHALVQG